MLFTWYDQDRFWSKWIPKFFFVFTLSIASLLRITLNNSLLLKLCFWLSWVVENSINLVLWSLKTKLSFEGHSDAVSRSDSNSSIHFFRFFGFECFYKVESSAYCNELQLTFSTKSTTYKLKRTGPKMLPCGTPKLWSLMDKLLSSTRTNYFRSETKLWISFKACLEKSNLWSFSNNVRWSVASSALQ